MTVLASVPGDNRFPDEIRRSVEGLYLSRSKKYLADYATESA